MKHKNPYILLTIIWAVLTAMFAVLSVVLFVKGEIGIGAVLIAVIGGFAFETGRLFENACQIAKLNREQKWLNDFAKSLQEFAQETAKAKMEEKAREPFGEFSPTEEVPFPEVGRKEK